MNLKYLRKSLTLTQTDVAKILGVSRTTVAMWEMEASKPQADMLPRLANLYGCKIDDLYKKAERVTPDNEHTG